MMKMMKMLLVAAATTWHCASFANDVLSSGDNVSTRPWLPLGVSLLTPPVQLPSPGHSVFGAMVNLGYGQMTDLCALDLGIVNNVTRNMVGLEVGAVNIADMCIGAQAGVINFSEKLCGVQVGAVNVTGDLHGLQLGLLNISSNGGALVFPILNFGF